jgi:hypothetical protein
MHPACAVRLAAQHSARLQAEAATRRLVPAGGTATAEPAASITQRLGWTLVHLGLRLALHQPG